MTRPLASGLVALTALMLSLPADATLVVIVPSSDGMVVAADSRTALLGVTCDSEFKITELRRPQRTVVAVTGEGVFVAPPDGQLKDVCDYLKSAPHLLDVPILVKRYLEKNPSLSKEAIDGLGAECVHAVERFRQTFPALFEQYVGREIFSVVIASYDNHSKNSLFMNFVVSIESTTHKVEATRFTRVTISPQSRKGVWSYGETGYLNKYVFGGVGRQYLTEETLNFILIDKPVADVRLDQAVAAATNVIEATSRTTESIPSPSGIGGPVDILLLSKMRRPKHIQWKPNP
jgi:hypothetical protein